VFVLAKLHNPTFFFYKHTKEEWCQKSTFINTKQTHTTTTTTTMLQLFPWPNSNFKNMKCERNKTYDIYNPFNCFSLLNKIKLKMKSERKHTHTHTHTHQPFLLIFVFFWSVITLLQTFEKHLLKIQWFFFNSQKNKIFGHISIHGSNW
jgi:hypothetical protein